MLIPLPRYSRLLGAAVGVGVALPFAAAVFAVFQGTSMARAMAVACLLSAAITGATFGRWIAARPTVSGIIVGAAGSVLIGLPIAALLFDVPGSRIVPSGMGRFLIGLFVYGLPVYFLMALPGLGFGVFLARRLGGRAPHAV